ncbi:MAG: hypothetical protein HDR22_07250 [Lachnospiraceae bacterium]|nr:hypothetical protein [Lachnospiraceae bacterium]
MITKKTVKVLTACLVSVFMIGVADITVHAETFRETEPNDTMETAEMIKANNETAKDTLEGTNSGAYVVEGYTSKSDPNWYKVYLREGTQYMTCNGEAFEFYILNENADIIYQDTYLKRGAFGPTAYAFDIPEAGYYYVRITGIVSSSKDYLFLIGSPTYFTSKCNIPCSEGTVTMTAGNRTQTALFNGGGISNLPEGAIAYSVKMSGIGTTNVDSIRLENNHRGLSFSLDAYTWRKDSLTSMNLPVESIWTASFGYKKASTFTPVLTVYYVYPLHGNVVQ